jgi:hypothetical protein
MKKYKDIQKALRTPIPANVISHKKMGGQDIKFVSICDIKDLLDARLDENIWEATVKSCQQMGDQIVMIVSLTIHCSDGFFTQDGTGVESINLKGFGDIGSNAYAQALRRSCESHGLGRELWRLELSDEQKELSRKQQFINKIGALKLEIKRHGGKVEQENLDAMDEAELIELGKEYKSQLERLQVTKGASVK